MYPLLAAIPIFVAAILLLVLKWPASRAMPAAFVSAALVAFFGWQMDWQHIAGESLLGVFKALELFTILFSALLIINQMRASGAMASINRAFGSVTRDPRIQSIIIGMGLGAFIAVSYTHLDVYKRQIQYRQRIISRNLLYNRHISRQGQAVIGAGLIF